MHSHTYSGNPLGCACALAVQKVLRRDSIIEKAQVRAEYLNRKLNERLGGHKNMGEKRFLTNNEMLRKEMNSFG